MNDGYTYQEWINDRGAGRALDRYLADRYPHATLLQWRDRIDAGAVRVEGCQVERDATLSLGQSVSWHRPPWQEPDAPLGLAVLYDDGAVMVVDKPAGLPTMAGGGFLQHTLVHQLRLLAPKAAPLHRLGRWTSGAVLCARGGAPAAKLAEQFSRRAVTKRYRTLVRGRPVRDCCSIDVRIGPVPYAPLGTVHAASPTGKAASSTVSVVRPGHDASLCEVEIHTGRPHQIRIHLAAAGHPLVGDPLYTSGGLPDPDGTALPGDGGYHLHAAELGFLHPESDLAVTVAAPLPDALR